MTFTINGNDYLIAQVNGIGNFDLNAGYVQEIKFTEALFRKISL